MAIKLNLGCGGNLLPGWENHDIDVNIAKPLPWSDNSAEFILIEHCLEHVSGPAGFRCLLECHRILQPDGVLRIDVPILDWLSDEAAIDIVVNHGHEVVFDKPILVRLLKLAGFRCVFDTERKACDGHWKVIGRERDDLETLRLEAIK